MDGNRVRLIITLSVGAAIFLVSVLIASVIATGWRAIAVTQFLEVSLAIVAIATLGSMKFADYGFKRPAPNTQRSTVKYCFAGFGLGALASLTMIGTGGIGNPVVKQLSFLQIMLFVWVFSSTVEEILTRGFIQSHLSPLGDRTLFSKPAPVMISALFFSAMHLTLLVRGADFISLAVTLIFTFLLGLLAGQQRHETGSLLPAIFVHMSGNIGGVFGGIIGVILKMVITGQHP